MIKELALFVAFCIASSTAFPADGKKNTKEKIVAIVPLVEDDLKPAETFYSGYNTGYPVGVNTYSGWRGEQPHAYGAGYGGGYVPAHGGIGYLGGYGNLGGGIGVGSGYGAGSGYGWKNGANRWAV